MKEGISLVFLSRAMKVHASPISWRFQRRKPPADTRKNIIDTELVTGRRQGLFYDLWKSKCNPERKSLWDFVGLRIVPLV
jgi:hypothetical protein